MPESNSPKYQPASRSLRIRGSDDAEERARALADAVARAVEPIDVVQLSREAFEAIAEVCARAWSSDAERDDALTAINMVALGALARLQGR